MPNGIDEIWLDNRQFMKKKDDKIRLLFVGKFIRRKNIFTVIKALKKLKSSGHEAYLTIVGKGKLENKLKKIYYENKDIIEIEDFLNTPQELMPIYRNADIFVMPSFRETFGLSYIEAISQGLPVIYSKGQGIDGYFNDGEIGFAVKQKDVGEIAEKILAICSNYDVMSKNCFDACGIFSWKKIAKEYIDIYNKAIKIKVV
jgi:glycosyltransferase involved in cell wall biosynthesis